MRDKTKGVQQASRRKVLKSVAVGGTVATAAAMPAKWTAPVVDAVITPAHAQTSDDPPAPTIQQGVYGTTSPLSLFLPRQKRSGQQFALLDMLISPAQADHLVGDICATDDGATTPGSSNLFFRVNADMSVDVAVDSLNDDNIACGNFGNIATVVGGNSISNTQIQMDDDEFVFLTNIVAISDTQITGNYSVDIDDTVECSGTFTATIGGAYPAAQDCRDDD